MPLTKLSEEGTFAAVGQFAPRQLEVAHPPEPELPPPTTIELNVGADEGSPVWQTPDDLSTGQKATAVLLLLLVESEAPGGREQDPVPEGADEAQLAGKIGGGRFDLILTDTNPASCEPRQLFRTPSRPSADTGRRRVHPPIPGAATPATRGISRATTLPTI
jgi:hypothetical protein